jgi:hypothetical protein
MVQRFGKFTHVGQGDAKSVDYAREAEEGISMVGGERGVGRGNSLPRPREVSVTSGLEPKLIGNPIE